MFNGSAFSWAEEEVKFVENISLFHLDVVSFSMLGWSFMWFQAWLNLNVVW